MCWGGDALRRARKGGVNKILLECLQIDGQQSSIKILFLGERGLGSFLGGGEGLRGVAGVLRSFPLRDWDPHWKYEWRSSPPRVS